jgi:sirohydrochlorin ferrochelatase
LWGAPWYQGSIKSLRNIASATHRTVTALPTFDSQTGMLIVGHGSRDPNGNAPLLDLCRSLETRLEITPVQPCYLELASPTIHEGLAALHRRGVVRVIVVPLQLTAGRHVRYDIPREVRRSVAKLSNMIVCFTGHLGAHPRMIDIADQRVSEALAGLHQTVGSTEFVLAARGSRDPLVRGEILRLAEIRQGSGQVGEVTPCFLAMNHPTLDEGVQTAISKSPTRIVIQPHLLFPGRLLRQIYARVAEMARRNPQIEWVEVGPLGPDVRLVDCALDLAHDALDREYQRAANT